MIRIYASKFNDEPHETYHGGGVTIDAWLQENVKAYRPDSEQQFSVAINGNLIDRIDWALTYFREEDEVDFVVEPKGTELFFGALFLVAVRTLTPKIPKVSSDGNKSGEDINEASIKGNKVKLNDPIPDIAGYRKIYPSYLSPPRRYFAGQRDQRMDMLVCVGVGAFDIPADKIQIGDTPLISLGSDASYAIYGPGQDVSGDSRALWWNDVTEVGSSSNGSSGLELTVSSSLTQGYSATSQQFNGKIISIPSGAGAFPSDWSAGLIIRATVPYQYNFADGGAGPDIISGPALNMLNPSVGDAVEISGVNAGYYRVRSFSPGVNPQMTLQFDDGTPVTSLTLGDIATSVGPRGQRYRINVFSEAQITVDRLTSSGATDDEWPGFDFLQTANAVISLDQSNLEGGYRGPFAMCPEDQKTSVLEWDIFLPSGLISLGSKGERFELTAYHNFEWRDMDQAGPWNVVSRSIAATTLDAIGQTFRIDLPYPMRAEARVKKVFVNQGGNPDTEYQDDQVWYGARSLLPSKASYPGATVMTFMVRGGDRLSATSESQVSIQGTRILPVRRNGFWQELRPTRDIAAYALYLLKQVGYTDADLDLPEWDRLDEIWRARGDCYDNVHATSATVQSILEDCLAAGFAEITVNRGLLRPVRDEPEDQRMALYTPQAMTEELDIKFDSPRPDDYDGVDVEYTDRDSWQVATVNCRLPGDLGRRVMKIQANGVLSRNKAYQIGMRQRRALKYRRKTFNWATEMAAFNSNYLDFVEVTGDTPGYAQSAVMHDYDPVSRIVTSGEPFDWDSSPNHFLSVRRSDGSLSGPYVVNRIDDYRLQLRDPLDFDPILDLSREPPHLSFGIGWGVQVTEVDPNSLEDVRVEARIYDARVYLDDESPAPN